MSQSSEEARFLENYNIHEYDVPLVTVDVVIFTIREGRLQVLLTFREQQPQKGKWAILFSLYPCLLLCLQVLRWDAWGRIMCVPLWVGRSGLQYAMRR